MVIATEILKKLTEKSVKGSGKLPQLAITSVVCIEVSNGNISLTTTDGATNLVVKDKVNTQETFFAATDSELFAKLVAKTTADKIKLERNENSLGFTGNGAYSLPLILDEEGNMARIPQILVSGEEYKCKASELKKLLMYNKHTVLKDMSTPMYTGYCIKGGYAYSFNISGGCVTKLEIDENVCTLLRPQMVELFDAFVPTDTVTIQATDKTVCFATDTVKIYSALLDGINEFATTQLKQLVADEGNFPNKITLSKVALGNALDRLSLFISPEEANAVEFQPLKESKALVLKNKSSAGVETIEILGDGNTIEKMSQYLDYKDLKVLCDAVKTENIVMRYNNSESLCIETDGASMFTTYLVAEDSMEEDFEEIEEGFEEEYDSEELDG